MELYKYVKKKFSENKKTENDSRQKRIKKVSKDERKKQKRRESTEKKSTLSSKHKNSSISLKREIDGIVTIKNRDDDFICALCLRFIACSVITPCGHVFCELCLQEYLLLFPVSLKELRKLSKKATFES